MVTKLKKHAQTEEEIIGNGNQDVMDYAPRRRHVTNWDIFFLFTSIISHIIDIGFDIFVAYRYYRNKKMESFILTVIFILFPAFINTAVSLNMYVMDKNESSVSRMVTQTWTFRVFILIFQLAPILRYCDSLAYAFKSRRAEKSNDKINQRHFYDLMLKEDSDVALLRVFEAFLEAAPQQVLQITLLLIDYRKEETHEIFAKLGSIVSSFLSMAWSMASYHRTIRFAQENKDNINIIGTVMQFCWQFSVTVSRIMSIALIASLFPNWTGFAIGCHWLVMTLWLTFVEGKIYFCNSEEGTDNSCFGRSRALLFNCILGLVYIFTYLTTSDGPTLKKYLFYYSLILIENLSSSIGWYIKGYDEIPPLFSRLLLGLPIISFILGIVFMLIYYIKFHPKKLSQFHSTPI